MIIAVGFCRASLVLFSTETGDAWLLDPADRLAARLARDGESEPIHIEETDTRVIDSLHNKIGRDKAFQSREIRTAGRNRRRKSTEVCITFMPRLLFEGDFDIEV